MAPAEPAAFVFRGDLCDRVDWSGFEGYGSIEPTEDDVAYYEEPMGRMECVRYFTRPGKRTNGDALTIRLKLGVSGDLAAEIERLRTEQSWSPVERSSWDGCVHRESEFDLEYTCTTDNLLVAFSSDTVIIEPDAAYTDAIFAFLDDVRALTKA
ncbi:hypothetical protein Pen01_39660 [Phytomonospora endophytica]|nr:hypothetical protein Pen01_39660 [Phytomonospora endophytica]